ncbi:hypothetical protein B0A50_00573 [Salinomyces thailandicus]|uniref:DUF7053 domain-containing protein n=1 Tax=Salinomyces thailandicus TaxID=706561 RepID=A0A4U0UEN8_9PEZI|nr:hypothetical protein B0A50_00573 [Salinomyces thailandica]
MGKRSVYTKVTPLPSNIPRQLALDMLHSHAEVIQLNPLVTGVKAIEAPRDAVSEEFFSQWYEISEVITWGPGLKKKINFKGVFHDQPWGLQSHVYAPAGTDLRNKYRIGGNEPGEPREPRELGLDTPLDGLYLREDVEITCAIGLTMPFVKKEMKQATGIMIERLNRKAELLDEGKLHAMFENGKLKTTKPNLAPTFVERPLPSPASDGYRSPPRSPGQRSDFTFSSPALDQQGFGRYRDLNERRGSHRQSSNVPPYQQNGYDGPNYATSGAERPGLPEINELPGSFYHAEQRKPSLYPPPLKPQGQTFRAELPGDYILPPRPLSSAKRGSSPYPPAQQQYMMPTPGLPNRQSSNSSSNYAITDSDPPPRLIHPAQRESTYAAQNRQHVAEWQRTLSTTSAGDSNSLRHSRSYGSNEHSEPDHLRFPNLSMRQSSSQQLHRGNSSRETGVVSRCPVCGMFEGDEAAITHHVSKAHFV